MGQALYRAYRPKSLNEIVGQEHITSSLANALKQGKLAHAYLFTGPRGTGKTSIARILAHEINGLPYTDDSMHLDIIEIDAASNRRIDEIRELRDKINVAPSLAKYKVYIIDEVHMLTREAFNALLKTLEEPPAHVVFILATTEVHKLPETIISRTQRFMFKPVDMAMVTAHLRTIADKEKMVIDDEALKLVAAHGEGSFRDSISLLDQTRGQSGDINADTVRALTGVPTTEAIEAICTALEAADATAIARSLLSLRDQGFGANQVAKQLGRRLRQTVLEGGGNTTTFGLMAKLLEVPVAHDPESYLELVMLSQALKGTMPAPPVAPTAATTAPASPSTLPSPAIQPSRPALTVLEVPPKPVETPAPQLAPQPVIKPVIPLPVGPTEKSVEVAASRRGTSWPLAEADAAIWPAVVSSLKKTHNTLYGIIRMATPIFYNDAVELHVTFDFHKKRLSEAKNQEVIANIIKEVTGQPMAVRCILDSKNAPKPIQTQAAVAIPTTTMPNEAGATDAAKPVSVSAISNIFGGAEVLDN